MAQDQDTHTHDQEFLDSAFDQAVERLEDGLPVAADDLLDGREQLRSQVEELVRLARQVTVGRSEALPTIHGYTILGELGRGGMGAVYLAQQERLGGRPVALKMLPPNVALSAKARQRFRSEAHAIARLRHPNIVGVYDVVEDADVYAYAMEWVDGKSLAELIDHLKDRAAGGITLGPQAEDRAAGFSPRGRPKGAGHDSRFADSRGIDAVRDLLGDDEHSSQWGGSYATFICRLGVAIARALAAVHREGLLHRDVKPSNILLRHDGTPLLTDFGLARDVESTLLTKTGHFVGTPAYAAPEQLRGDTHALDERTDIYGLGVTLYHALALRVPFVADSTAEILRQIEAGRATALRRVNSAVPNDLQTIVTKAMDSEPARRYESADALAGDLDRLLNLQPIKAKPAGIVTRTIKLARRNRRVLTGAVGGGILAFLLAAALVVYAFVRPGWVDDHVREARLGLLDPVNTDRIFSSLLWGRALARGTSLSVSEEFCADPLAHYGWARRLAPFDDSIRREQLVVATARELCVANEVGARTIEKLARSTPLAERYARDWADVGGIPAVWDRSEFADADTSDVRALGLLAFVCGDVENALLAWNELDQIGEPDPLVEAALGLLHLASDQPQRAYPRLRDACQAFPDVGFLHVSLADAALQCGDYQRAESLLERANDMDRLDHTSGLERVWADLYAETGRDELALRFWRSSGGSVASYHRGRHLEAHHDYHGALLAYGHAGSAGNYRHAWGGFQRVAPLWWTSLTQDERWRVLRESLDEIPSRDHFPYHSLILILTNYAEHVLLPGGGQPTAAKLVDTPLEVGSLEAIALGLRAPWPTSRVDVFLYYPPLLKDLQATVLLSPWPVRGSLLLAAMDDVWRELDPPAEPAD